MIVAIIGDGWCGTDGDQQHGTCERNSETRHERRLHFESPLLELVRDQRRRKRLRVSTIGRVTYSRPGEPRMDGRRRVSHISLS
jgi:hypothetical protein